ncbi:condensation domain-containing protein [Streptomyces scopuliridis]|uniref:condensation domain-containing protein n=1 Tax=Streptomyces scopuliridis TaxID=452529 RepID=UPI0035DD28B5
MTYPLSCGQELMLAFSAEAGFPVSTWNHPTVFDLRDYDEDEVRSAVRSIVDRHEVLRTRLGQLSGRHCQVVPGNCDDWVHRVALPANATPEELAAAEAAAPFALYDGPLARSLVVPRAEGGARLILTYNHLVSDRKSEALLAGELVARLESPHEAPSARPPQFGEFARWERAEVSRYSRSTEAVPRWRDYEELMRRLDPSAAPVQHPAGRVADARALVGIRFTEADLAALTRCAKDQGVTLNVVVLTAFAAALSVLPGIGLLLGEKTVRSPYRFAGTAGPFSDLWAVDRSEVDGDVARGLASVQRQVLRAIDGAMPFLLLVRRTRWLARELVRPEHGRWAFYQYFADPPVRTGARVATVRFHDSFGVESGMFGLHAQVQRVAGGLTMRLTHRLDTLTARDVDALTDRIQTLLSRMTEHAIDLDRTEPRLLTADGHTA